MSQPDLFIFAGEPSGDLHGDEIISVLLAQNPALTITGVMGPKMRAHPVTSILPMEEFQVMGFIDVFLALPKLIRHFHFVKNAILKQNPAKVLLIDYPGFNLRLAKSLRKHGYRGKLIHYICPSVWAWGKKRIPLIAENYDLLLSVLPFEKELFKNTSLPVHYIGNPLAKHIANHTPSLLPELGDGPVLALFPGSRTKEIERNLPQQLFAARRLLTINPHLKIALSVSHPRLCSRFQQLCAHAGIAPQLIPTAYTYDLMQRTRLALATSGTVTLELALHAIPTVVTYGISPLDLFIAKHLLRILLPFYSLPNIIAEKEIFPELIGPHLRHDALFNKAAHLLSSEGARATITKACHALQKQLNQKNASHEAAQTILSL